METKRCFYHSADQDGKCSAAIVRYKYPEVLLHPIDYVDDFDINIFNVVESTDEVFMVDFCMLPINKMKKLSRQCNTIHWIDHHIKAIKEAESLGYNPDGLRQDGTAGCVLTWKYLFGDMKVPYGIELIGKYDVHKMDDKNIYPYHFGIEFNNLNPESDFWIKIFEDDKKTFDRLIEIGKILSDFKKRGHVNKALSHGFPINLGDYKAFAVNGTVDLDDLVESNIYDPNEYDFLLMFYRLANTWKFSLRSLAGGVDVAEISRRFKGGGHVNAAGFDVKDDSFISKLIKGKIVITKN